MRLLLMFALLYSLQTGSPPPTPAPTKITNEKQKSGQNKTQETNTEQKNSHPPIAANSPAITDQGNESTNEKSTKTSTDWWLTAFTGALVLVAVLQFVAMHRQAEYMRKGLRIAIRSARAAKQAATAAKDSADVLKGAERAWLIIRPSGMGKHDQLVCEQMDDTRYVYHVENIGRTIARVIEIGTKAEMRLRMDNLPEKIDVESWKDRFIVAPGEVRPFGATFENAQVLTAEDIALIKKRERFLCCYGYIKYLDASGMEHISCFIHHYQTPSSPQDRAWEGWVGYTNAPPAYTNYD